MISKMKKTSKMKTTSKEKPRTFKLPILERSNSDLTHQIAKIEVEGKEDSQPRQSSAQPGTSANGTSLGKGRIDMLEGTRFEDCGSKEESKKETSVLPSVVKTSQMGRLGRNFEHWNGRTLGKTLTLEGCTMKGIMVHTQTHRRTNIMTQTHKHKGTDTKTLAHIHTDTQFVYLILTQLCKL